MKGIVFVVLFLLLHPPWPVLGQQSGISIQGGEAGQAPKKGAQGAQPLTNDSIIKLVKAGLGEDTVIKMVDTQPGKYSLGVEDIIALKKAGVSEKVITAMLNKSASAPPPASLAPAGVTELNRERETTNQDKSSRESPVGQDAKIPNEPGLYMMDQGRSLHRIEGRVTSFERSGSRLASAATLGIHANRINIQIPGSRAHVTVAPQPTFYYRVEPGKEEGLDLILTQVTVVHDRRQFEVGAQGMWRSSKGVSVRHQLDYDAKEVEPGVYRVVPMHELERGQYAFYMLRGVGDHLKTYKFEQRPVFRGGVGCQPVVVAV